jgi:hypothetical protein
VLSQPFVVLRAREHAGRGAPVSEKTPGRKLVDDFGILIGTSRRARAKLVQGVLAHLLPPEEAAARRAARQAQWECTSLFRSAAALLSQPEPPLGAHGLERVAQEVTDAG